jgi:predicted nucleic acid-binding protein
MSGTKNSVYYWDACVYMAWLKQEDAYKDALPHIAEILRLNKERKNIIITSTLTICEVLESGLNADQDKEFLGCFRFKEHVSYDVDPPIAHRARELRDYYRANPVNGKSSLTTPDAIHLATATIHGADAFHTFDNGGMKDGEGKKGIPLLKLGGKIGKYDLAIGHPHIDFTPSLLDFSKPA